ncbi:MAG: STAS/SEC14 domain-containing protein [Chthoniobacteraceae bacterium]
MTTHVDEAIHGKVLEVHLSGKLTSEDYAKFVPDAEALIQKHGKIRILAMLDAFHGWNAGALWEDIKWDARHFKHVERIAVVGEKKWHRWMVGFCKPFTSAEVRYFEHDQLAAARLWVEAE